jgi:endoglucanase
LKRPLHVSIAFILLVTLVLAGCESASPNAEGTTEPDNVTSVPEGDTASPPAEAEAVAYEGKGAGMIHINQIGYRPNDKKIAIVNSQELGLQEDFEVVRSDTKAVVFTGKMTGKRTANGIPEPVTDFFAREKILYADFSAVTEPGEYIVSVPKYGESYPFVIGEHVYKEVKNALLKALYYQRCGIALDAEHAGEWTHDACHLELATLYEDPSKQIDVTGGWHDAGDYGRYVSPGANTVAYLLLAHELFPDAFQEAIGIPESGGGMPDLLREAKYELDWLMKMQDPASGGAYHKVTGKNFEGFVMPEDDHSPQFVLPISPTATGDLAAILAQAARVYKPYDAAFADQALSAAEKAWQWLASNPDAPGYKNPSDVLTGEYGDDNSKDERYWAAVELYKTTGKAEYHDAVKEKYAGVGKLGLGWGDMSGFGTISYLFMDEALRDPAVYNALSASFFGEADKLVGRANEGYLLPMNANDYYWGSNMGAMNKGVLLSTANLLKPKAEYDSVAQHLFNYLLGVNAMDQSYVSGFGSKPMLHPHHRPSGSDGIDAPVPGLVSGGPNKNRQDPTAEAQLPEDVAPMKAYVDDQGSWSTNEIAIYWNGPAIFVAGYLDR